MLTSSRSWVRGLILGFVLGATFAAGLALASSGRGTPIATLQPILDLLGGLRQPSNGQTRLLFTAVQAGSPPTDTVITIFNTGRDPYGTEGRPGACAVTFYGTVGADPQSETLRITPEIVPGDLYSWSVSAGDPANDLFLISAFTGYAIATCDFPLAHAWYETRGSGGERVVSQNALVLPSTRSTAFVEAGGQ
jgi:hypothetical protein